MQVPAKTARAVAYIVIAGMLVGSLAYSQSILATLTGVVSGIVNFADQFNLNNDLLARRTGIPCAQAGCAPL